MPENIYPELAPGKQPKMFTLWKEHSKAAAEFVREKGSGRYRLPNVLAGPAYGLFRLIAPLLLKLFKKSSLQKLQEQSETGYSDYGKLVPFMDNSFSVSRNCTGCGTCVKVCPVENIELQAAASEGSGLSGGGPRWLHRCEFCLACLHWCPAGAISSSGVKGTRQYHHPDVSVSDMMRNG